MYGALLSSGQLQKTWLENKEIKRSNLCTYACWSKALFQLQGNGQYTYYSFVRIIGGKENGAPGEILASVSRSVDAFVGKAPQFDDLTMLCIEYKGPAEES